MVEFPRYSYIDRTVRAKQLNADTIQEIAAAFEDLLKKGVLQQFHMTNDPSAGTCTITFQYKDAADAVSLFTGDYLYISERTNLYRVLPQEVFNERYEPYDWTAKVDEAVLPR